MRGSGPRSHPKRRRRTILNTPTRFGTEWHPRCTPAVRTGVAFVGATRESTFTHPDESNRPEEPSMAMTTRSAPLLAGWAAVGLLAACAEPATTRPGAGGEGAHPRAPAVCLLVSPP